MGTDRDQRLAQLVNEIVQHVRRLYPHLTEPQAAKIADTFASCGSFGLWINEGLKVGYPDAAEIEDILRHYERHKYPALFRRAPTADQAYALVLKDFEAQRGRAPSAEEKINLWREYSKLGPDELLARVPPEANLEAAQGPEQQSAPSSAVPLHLRSREEVLAEYTRRTGEDWRRLLPSRLREIERTLRDETAPKPTPGLEKARAYGALGKELSPEDRIRAYREQQAARVS